MKQISIFLIALLITAVALAQNPSALNNADSIEKALLGHWRIYYPEEHLLKSTITFTDSIVYLNRYCLCTRNTSPIFREEEGIYFRDEHIDVFGLPEIRNDTLFLKLFDYKDKFIGSFYGLKADQILPIDVYDDDLLVDLALPSASNTIFADSLFYRNGDIIIGRAKKSYRHRRTKKGDISTQVNDVLIEKKDIKLYIAQEKDMHAFKVNQINVTLHVSKDVPQEFIDDLIRTTDLIEHVIYQAFIDQDEERIGFKMVHDGGGDFRK